MTIEDEERKPIPADEAEGVLLLANEMPTLVRVMKRFGMSRQEALDGLTRAIDLLWDSTPTETSDVR